MEAPRTRPRGVALGPSTAGETLRHRTVEVNRGRALVTGLSTLSSDVLDDERVGNGHTFFLGARNARPHSLLRWK
jgi:hypothetical protein